MPISPVPSRKQFTITVAALAIVSLSICAVALAAHPAKGKTYTGTISQSFKGSEVVNPLPISFAVSKSGKKVQHFSLSSNVPFYCEGGGFGGVSGGSAKVTNTGTFKVKLPIVFAPTHEHQGFAIITGKFRPKKGVKGSITTEFTKIKSCGGKSPYTATAK
jgi:hypothetical protein